MTVVHALAFGDPDAGAWGVGWLGDPGASARVAIRRGAAVHVLEGTLAPDATDDAWRLDGDAISLVIEPTAPASHGGPSGELQTTDRICRVTARLTMSGEPSELESLGWHSAVEGLGDPLGIESFRWAAAWLAPGDGFSLVSVRPRKARGHAGDLIAAALIEDPAPPRIHDPRLSTTYSDAGLPIRAGLELWPEAHDDDPEADRAPHYPRRAAGALAGDSLAWDAGGFQLNSLPMRWRSRGRAGPGVYVLGRRT